jgi:hypothetical protein
MSGPWLAPRPLLMAWRSVASLICGRRQGVHGWYWKQGGTQKRHRHGLNHLMKGVGEDAQSAAFVMVSLPST